MYHIMLVSRIVRVINTNDAPRSLLCEANFSIKAIPIFQAIGMLVLIIRIIQFQRNDIAHRKAVDLCQFLADNANTLTLFILQFVKNVARHDPANLLIEGGVVEQKTDNLPFFKFSIESFEEAGWDILYLTYDLYSQDLSDNIQTEYEGRFVSSGMLINKLIATPPKNQ